MRLISCKRSIGTHPDPGEREGREMAAVKTADVLTATAAAVLSAALLSYLLLSGHGFKLPWLRDRGNYRRHKSRGKRNGLVDAVGNTPLIRINSLSDATGCEVKIFFIQKDWIFYILARFFLAILDG